MRLFHLRGTLAPFAILTAFTFACGGEVETNSTTRAADQGCDDCPNVDVDLIVDAAAGTFDIDIAAFPNFDANGLTALRVEFERGSSSEYADLSIYPTDIEGGVSETDIELPGSIDYTVNSGLSARLVYDEPPDLDLAESPTTITAAQ